MNHSIYQELVNLKSRGHLKKTLNSIFEIEQEPEKHDPLFLMKLSLLKAETYLELGWLDEAETTLKKLSQLENEEDINQIAAKIHSAILITEINQLRGLNEDTEHVLTSIIQELELNPHGLPDSVKQNLLHLARITWGKFKARKGHVAKAIGLLTENLNEIRDYTTSTETILQLHNMIGRLYLRIGMIDDAFTHIKKVLQLLEDQSSTHYHPRELACAYDSMARAFARSGDIAKALQFSKDSLMMVKKTDTNRCHATFSFMLALLSLRLEEHDTFEICLKQLESLAEQSEIEETKQKHLLIRAIQQKSKKRLEYICRSQKILKDLLERPTVNYEIKTAALMNLVGILIGESVMTGNPVIFDELNARITELKHICEITDDHELTTKVMILQAKIAMFEKDMTKSKRHLNDAHQLAAKHKDETLERSIANHQDTLLSLTDSGWFDENLHAGHEHLLEVLEIEESLTFAPFIAAPIRPHQEERPIWLVIIKQGGISVYSKMFEPELSVNEQFISGLVTAIDILGKESLPNSGSIERIIFQEYKIVIKRSNSLLFCYAFFEQSYPALQKLDDFIVALREKTDLWDVLDREIPFLTQDEITSLNNLAEMIFRAG